jgi:hypothetical protein
MAAINALRFRTIPVVADLGLASGALPRHALSVHSGQLVTVQNSTPHVFFLEELVERGRIGKTSALPPSSVRHSSGNTNACLLPGPLASVVFDRWIAGPDPAVHDEAHDRVREDIKHRPPRWCSHHEDTKGTKNARRRCLGFFSSTPFRSLPDGRARCDSDVLGHIFDPLAKFLQELLDARELLLDSRQPDRDRFGHRRIVHERVRAGCAKPHSSTVQPPDRSALLLEIGGEERRRSPHPRPLASAPRARPARAQGSEPSCAPDVPRPDAARWHDRQ